MTEIREESIVVRVIARFVFSWSTLYVGAKRNVEDHQLFIKIDTPSNDTEIITCLRRLTVEHYIPRWSQKSFMLFPSKTGWISLKCCVITIQRYRLEHWYLR